MRQLAVVVVLLCAARCAVAVESPAPKSDVAKLKSDIANEAAIRTIYEQFTAAWNKHDVPAMTSLWAEDGDHVEPDGQVAKGRDQVTELFKKQHASIFKSSHLALKIDTVWFITADVALIDGTYELSGVVLPDGTAIPPRKGLLSTNLLSRLVHNSANLPHRKVDQPTSLALDLTYEFHGIAADYELIVNLILVHVLTLGILQIWTHFDQTVRISFPLLFPDHVSLHSRENSNSLARLRKERDD